MNEEQILEEWLSPEDFAKETLSQVGGDVEVSPGKFEGKVTLKATFWKKSPDPSGYPQERKCFTSCSLQEFIRMMRLAHQAELRMLSSLKLAEQLLSRGKLLSPEEDPSTGDACVTYGSGDCGILTSAGGDDRLDVRSDWCANSLNWVLTNS